MRRSPSSVTCSRPSGYKSPAHARQPCLTGPNGPVRVRRCRDRELTPSGATRKGSARTFATQAPSRCASPPKATARGSSSHTATCLQRSPEDTSADGPTTCTASSAPAAAETPAPTPACHQSSPPNHNAGPPPRALSLGRLGVAGSAPRPCALWRGLLPARVRSQRGEATRPATGLARSRLVDGERAVSDADDDSVAADLDSTAVGERGCRELDRERGCPARIELRRQARPWRRVG